MRRNLDKALAEGDKLLEDRRGLDLNVSEIYAAYDMARSEDEETGLEKVDTAMLLFIGFRLGIAIGYRAGLRDAKAKK